MIAQRHAFADSARSRDESFIVLSFYSGAQSRALRR